MTVFQTTNDLSLHRDLGEQYASLNEIRVDPRSPTLGLTPPLPGGGGACAQSGGQAGPGWPARGHSRARRPLPTLSSCGASLLTAKQTRPLSFFSQSTCCALQVLFTFHLLFLLKPQHVANHTGFWPIATTHILPAFSPVATPAVPLSRPWYLLQSSPDLHCVLLQRL